MRLFLLNKLEVLPSCNDPRLHNPLVVRCVAHFLRVGIGIGLSSLPQVDLNVLLGLGIFLLGLDDGLYNVKDVDLAFYGEAKARMVLRVLYVD